MQLRPIGTEFIEVQPPSRNSTDSRPTRYCMRVVAYDACADFPAASAPTYSLERIEPVWIHRLQAPTFMWPLGETLAMALELHDKKCRNLPDDWPVDECLGQHDGCSFQIAQPAPTNAVDPPAQPQEG